MFESIVTFFIATTMLRDVLIVLPGEGLDEKSPAKPYLKPRSPAWESRPSTTTTSLFSLDSVTKSEIHESNDIIIK